MNFATLMAKNVFRNGRRTALTGLSLGISMTLVVLLQTILLELTKPTNINDSIPRLVARHRTSLTMALPRPYEKKLRDLDGVVDVTPMIWFQGVWRDDSFENFFPRFATDPETFFNVYIDYKPDTPEMLEAFKKTRTGALVGRTIANRYGFKLGDKITIKGDIYDATPELTVVGFFDGPQPEWVIFPIKYLDELLGETVRSGSFMVLAKDPARVETLIPEIEEMFRNSEAEVKAETEKAFQLSFVEMLGNIKVLINGIVSVVVFAVLMIAASTMALAVRERTREVATLKAIGFTRSRVLGMVVGEGMLVSFLGGSLGLGLSWWLLPQPRLFLAVASGAAAAAAVGIPVLFAVLLLPESGTRGAAWSVRRFCSKYGLALVLGAGALVCLAAAAAIPPKDWFTFSGGMIQSMNVRGETMVLCAWITAAIGLGSSLWPAWQASRMSVLDGLRTLE